MRFPFFTVFWMALLLAVSAVASPFDLGPSSRSLVLAPGFHHADIALPIQPAAGGFDYGQVQVSSNAAWVTPQLDAAGQKVVLQFTTAALATGSHSAILTATHGADTSTVTLTATSSALNIFKLMDDPHRSRMYGIQLNGTLAGSLLVIDPLTASPISSITVGRRPTGMAISDDGSELFVINCVDKTVSVIDLQTLAVSETIVLPVFATSQEEDVATANVSIGPGDVLYYSGSASAPRIYVYDRNLHQVLQTVSYAKSPYGFGDFALSADKSSLIAWGQYGWISGFGDSSLARYEVSSTGTLTAKEISSADLQLKRSPLEAPILIANDGETTFVKTLAVDSGSVSLVYRHFDSDVFSITRGGEIAVTDSAIYQVSTGVKLLDLPVATSIHAISSDYARLVYFDPASRQMGAVDLFALIGAEAMRRVPSPAQSSSVIQPERLSWASTPGANGYQIYFGSSFAEVDAATPVSPSYLGSALDPMIPAQGGLTSGTTYYWRADTVFESYTAKGSVYSFTISPIVTSVLKVEAVTVEGHSDHRVSVQLSSLSSDLSWTATADQPWVDFTSSTGTAPGQMEVRLNAGSLEPGIYRAIITVSEASSTLFTLPLELKVEALHLMHLESVANSPIIYGVSQDTATQGATAYLLEVDTASEAILRVVPAGSSASDLAIHQAEDRIYIPDWRSGSLLAFDKSSLALVRTYTSSEFQKAFRVAAGKNGRLAVEGLDQWVNMSIFDTINGTLKDISLERAGGAAFEPTGQFYYHGDSNISNAEINKLDVTGDVFSLVSRIRTTSYSYYGSNVVVVSEDGQSVFWNGSHFNANLVELWSMADKIYCISADGRLAFGDTKIYDTSTRQHILMMPVTASVSAFNTTTNKLVVQNGSRLRYYGIEFPLTLSAPVLSAGSSGLTTTSLPVTWMDNSLETDFNLQYRPFGSVEWIAQIPSPKANTTTATLTGLQPATLYEIRVQARTPDLVSPWSNTLEFRTQDLPPPTVNISTVWGSADYMYISFQRNYNPSTLIVERAEFEDGPWTVLDTLPGDASPYHDYRIRTDVTYYYRIQAVRGSFSTYSNVKSGTLAGPILNVSYRGEVEGKVNLQVSSNKNFLYVLQRRQGTSGTWQDLKTFTSLGYPHADSDIIPSTTYQYRLKALPETLTDRVSNVITVTTLPPSPPPAPRNFEITNITASQISLRWSHTYSADGYRIERKLFRSNNWILLATVDNDVTSYADTTPITGYAYEYRLIAFNGEGFSSPVTLFYPFPIPPVSALNLRVTMEDDFDPDRDPEQWALTSVLSSVDGGQGFNGSKSLWFGHEGLRVAETRSVDASGHGFLEFSLRAGNSSRDGTAYWENSIYEDEIILEYSINGTAWLPLQKFDMVYPALSDWTDFSIPFTHRVQSKTVRFRWRQKSSSYYSAGPWALDNVRIRSSSSDDVTIYNPPGPRLAAAGSSTNISVAVNQPTASFQWFKDGEMVPDATLSTYSLASAEPAHSGSYTCEIRYGEALLTTEPVMLGVIEKSDAAGPVHTPLGGGFSLGMQIHPAALADDLIFSWMRTEGDLAGIGTVSGEQTSTLTVTGATASAESTYLCRVTYQKDNIIHALDVGPYEVRLLRRPTIQPVADVDVVSGSPVDIPIEVVDLPLTIQVDGLPKGLFYDAANQRIRGSIKGNKSYTLTVEASNLQGAADPLIFQLNVVGFPAALAGSYQGVFLNEGMDTDPALQHGAQMAFKITNKGAATGTVMIQGKNRRFVVKSLEAAPDGAWARLQTDIDGPDGSPLRAVVEIVGGAGLHEAELRTAGEGEPQMLAEGQVVRNDWSKANPALYAGGMNTALLPPEWMDASADNSWMPKGTGFLNLKLTPQGTVICKGRLADGQAVTGSTILGPEGHVPVFTSLYRGTGSFGTLLKYEEGQADGTAYWGKDDQGEASKDRLYKRGIVRHELTVTGGLYLRPSANAPLFTTQEDANSPATLMLTRALLRHPGITQVLSFTDRHQAIVPREKLLNPNGLTLKMNAATGAFTGKFKLEDPNPLKPSGTLRRTVSFQGSLIPGLERGCGYFLLPELPSADIPRNSLNNTPVWSGSVELIPEVE